MVHGYLHRRVANDEVSADDVSLDSRSQKDTVRIPNNGVLLDHVPGVVGSNQTDAEVVPLSRIAISTEPVPTEPVAAGAALQSYAATGIGSISISHGNVASSFVTKPPPVTINPERQLVETVTPVTLIAAAAIKKSLDAKAGTVGSGPIRGWWRPFGCLRVNPYPHPATTFPSTRRLTGTRFARRPAPSW